MQTAAIKIEELINHYLPSLKSVPESEMSRKPSLVKWSKKEILGHLVDSAQNNIRRFIVAQYEHEPKIVYNQDVWVSASDYRHFDTDELIQLWVLINKQICSIIKKIPEDRMNIKCRTEDLHSLEWLADDYAEHMKHHLHQLLELEPIPYS